VAVKTTYRGRAGKTRRALAIAGDDAEAKEVVAGLIGDLGFDVVDAGPVVRGVALPAGHPGVRDPSSSFLFAALPMNELPPWPRSYTS
jgi:8-hydroxy-5-deazaflavin:NADPH oxidoreductase